MLEEKIVPLNIPAPNNSNNPLPNDILFHRFETINALREIEEADHYLSMALGEIQVEREKNSNYIATTGVKDDMLRKEIEDFLAEKKLKINGEKSSTNISKKGKHSVALDIAEKMEWDKVEIKFCEGDAEVEIFYDKIFKGKYSFTDLGFFKGKKDSFKKDNSWYFLYALSSYYKKENEATIENLANNMSELIEKKFKNDSVHHIKMTCKNKMYLIFNTKEDPFIHNGKYYQPKFKLLPIPLLRNEELWSTRGNRYNDNIGTGEEDNTENGL